MRRMTEIQADIAQLAERAHKLKTDVKGLIAEITRDHYKVDESTAWEIALGNQRCFLGFRLKGHLEVIVDDVLDDLESGLREAAAVTEADLEREWQESQREVRQVSHPSSRSSSQPSSPGVHSLWLPVIPLVYFGFLLAWLGVAIRRTP